MRVSVNSYTNAMLDQFNQLAGLQYSLQSQASTGLRVQSASDDPAAMADTLNLAANKSADTQWSANISTLQSRANQIDTVLQSLQTKVSRAGEIATLGANSNASKDALNNYADEVNTMIADTVKLGNTQDSVTGNYLFGGTNSGSSPFTVTKNSNGDITGVTYNGNTSTRRMWQPELCGEDF
jgi:flagellar hook-associated protein 3 FlgL